MPSESPTQGSPASDNHDDKAGQQDGQSSPQTPETATKTDSPTPPNNRWVSCNKKRDWFDWVKFGAEIIGLLVLIGYTTFAALQWCEMKQTTIATQQSVQNAEKHFRTDERAWIGIESIETKPLSRPQGWHGGELITLSVSLKNYGKTSGRNLVVMTNSRGVNNHEDTKPVIEGFLAHLLPERVPRVLAPGASTAISKFGGQVQLPHMAFGYLQSADLVGRIEYDDVFGRHHWSTFCYEMLENGEFLACEYGNDEDQDAETTQQ